MTSNTDRIEAAARAICEADPLSPQPDAPIIWNGKSANAWEPRAEILARAIDAGLFCHPAKAWLAPMEPTEEMIDAADDEDGHTPYDVPASGQMHYIAMRQAYLKDT